MAQDRENPQPQAKPTAPRIDLRFSSNALLLSWRQWAVAGIIFVSALVLAPRIGERLENFHPPEDYRIPYDLSNDYWLFGRYARQAASRERTLVIGDSVVWGQYVKRGETLSHYLNDRAGEARFANLGLDGGHPVALAGLLRYYGGDIVRTRVVLHCNLLWTASKKHDLTSEKEFRFNHPTLAPQFVPSIPCYTEPYSRRLGYVIERQVPFFGWTNHLRVAYLAGMDLPSWTMEHPVENPLTATRLPLVPAEEPALHEPVAWTARGITKQDFEWVDLDASLQWRFFRQAVETLRARDDKVFVLVGPFNEHMLTDESLKTYAARRRTVEKWLRREGIPYAAPAALPSDLYADASHPLAEGYRMLARQLWEDEAFTRFAADSPSAP